MAETTIVMTKRGYMIVSPLILMYLIALVINIIYSVEYSKAVESPQKNSDHLKEVNDYQVSAWALNSIPIVNVVISGLFASKASKLK